jgi:DNA helicase IV
VTPATLVTDLLTRPQLLAAAARGVLDRQEQSLLSRRRAREWTPGDGPLVDEAKELIYGQSRTYGYAIVDEAQDLSPMELRMLARRCPSGSMTLLGDLAQAIGPWGLRTWADVASYIPASRSSAVPRGPGSSSGPGGSRAAPPGQDVQVVELRHGYRSTAQVLDLAARLLPEAAPGVRPIAAVRPGRRPPALRRVAPEDLVQAVVGEAVSLVTEYETIGLVVAQARLEEVVAAASARLPSVGEATRDGLGRRVTVLTAESAKGLEFDAVLVGEPAQIVAERADHAAGLRLLYVALTRPTQYLGVVHSTPLPPALGD